MRRFRDSQIVIITNSVVVSSVGIQMVGCTTDIIRFTGQGKAKQPVSSSPVRRSQCQTGSTKPKNYTRDRIGQNMKNAPQRPVKQGTHYENRPIQIYRKFHLQKLKIFRQKTLIFFFSYFCSKHKLWYSLEPPRLGGSNEYPRSMFSSKNKKNNVYPCKPQFHYIKVEFKGVKII